MCILILSVIVLFIHHKDMPVTTFLLHLKPFLYKALHEYIAVAKITFDLFLLYTLWCGSLHTPNSHSYSYYSASLFILFLLQEVVNSVSSYFKTSLLMAGLLLSWPVSLELQGWVGLNKPHLFYAINYIAVNILLNLFNYPANSTIYFVSKD